MVMVGRGAEGSLRVYVYDTTLRSQNAEQLRENGWLRGSRTPPSFKTDIWQLKL